MTEPTAPPASLTEAEIEAIRRESMEFAGIGLYRYRFDGTLLFIDRGAMRILGVEDRFDGPEQLAGRDIGELIVYTGPRHRLRETIRRQGHARGLEYSFRTLDGEDRWALHDSYATTDPGTGEEVIQVIIRDITRRKRAERRLAEEKERLRVTLRSIGDGVITTDRAGTVQLINGAAEELTGWLQDEACGRPLSEVFPIVDENSRAPCENPVDKVLREGRVVGLANHTMLVDRNGVERLIADSGAPIRAADGGIVGVVLVFRDVTARHRMEREMARVERLSSVGILAGGIAHDFNNLLTAITMSLSMLALGRTADREIQQWIEPALSAARRAEHLTSQLLTFSRGGTPVRKATDLADLVREVGEFSLRGSRCRLSLDLPGDLWNALIDGTQITQVLQNLLINAGQAMPAGGTITVRCENVRDPGGYPALEPGSYVRLTVEDQGSGIPASQIERVFDPFFTTKQQGSGLGLAVCHSIVARHDGRITVESVPERGSTFEVLLPATEDAVAPPKTMEAPLPRPTPSRILVMDDDETLRASLGQLLRQLGQDVELTADGAEALERCREAQDRGQPHDLVLLDLTVPGGMGGVEALERMREIEPDVRAVAMSGYARDEVLVRPAEFGFAGALPKPFDVRVLSELLAALLDRGE